jgi:lipopolysaccharide transport LptD-like protein
MRGVLLAVALLICAQAPRVAAQPQSDTSLKRESGFLLPSPIDGQGARKGVPPRKYQGPPVYIQTDKLVYDDKKNRVIAQGNVEIYFKNYILTADKVVYDKGRTRWSLKVTHS